jgi:hypothetical protein
LHGKKVFPFLCFRVTVGNEVEEHDKCTNVPNKEPLRIEAISESPRRVVHRAVKAYEIDIEIGDCIDIVQHTNRCRPDERELLNEIGDLRI